MEVLIPDESQIVEPVEFVFFPMKMQQVYIRDLFCHLQAVEAPSTNDPSTSNAFVAKGWNFSDDATSPSAEATKTLQFVSS